jgi:DNA-directed RNA polymerase sigma subunit (sigma70/sigma32)
MEEAISEYLRQINDVPECNDSVFHDLLVRARSGDDEARREISGRCLRVAFELAEAMPAPPPDLDRLDRIQEANAGLHTAILTFSGSTAVEFIDYARRTIGERLESLRGKAA